jgi:hypothetical protein
VERVPNDYGVPRVPHEYGAPRKWARTLPGTSSTQRPFLFYSRGKNSSFPVEVYTCSSFSSWRLTYTVPLLLFRCLAWKLLCQYHVYAPIWVWIR